MTTQTIVPIIDGLGGTQHARVDLAGDGSIAFHQAIEIGGTTISAGNPLPINVNGGTVAVSNLPGTQAVSGSVSIAGTANVAGTLAVSNFPGTQAVSAAALPLPAGAAQDGTDGTGITPPTGATGIRGWLSGIYQSLVGTLSTSRTWVLSGGTDSVAVSNFPSQAALGTVSLTGSTVAGAAALAAVDPQGNLATKDAGVQGALSADTPLFVVLTGDPTGDFAQMNLLEEMLKDNASLTIGVRVSNQPTVDAAGRLILSDGVQINVPNLPVGASFIIDTTGYQSINITTQALVGTLSFSSDGLTWTACLLATPSTGTTFSGGSIAAAAHYITTVVARWFRITPTTAGTATVYLRQGIGMGPIAVGGNVFNNVSQIGGLATGTVPGGTGVMPVGGSTAVGGSAATAPVEVGGVDSGGLVRRLLQDTSGRVIDTPYAPDFTGTMRQLSAIASAPGVLSALATVDQGSADGLALTDIALLSLQELRIISFYLFRLLSEGGAPSIEDPTILRADPNLLV